MMRIMGVMNGLFVRHQVLSVALMTVPIGCAMLGKLSRMGTADNNQVEAAVSAALVQWKTEMHSAVDAAFEARLGDNVGRDQSNSTTDSLTSVILAGGMIGAIIAALAVYYRVKMSGSEKVSRRLIGEIEKRRDRSPCQCGKCADCMVSDLRLDQDRVGRLLKKKVKMVTG
jgi:hypothetical protein